MGASWGGCLSSGGREGEAQLQGLGVFVQVAPKQENLGEKDILKKLPVLLPSGLACPLPSVPHVYETC